MCMRHSFTATALWMIDQRKITCFYAFCLRQMIFLLGEVEGANLLPYLSRIDFLRVSWMVIHFLPSLAEYARKGVTSRHCRYSGSKKSWSNFPKNIVTWVCALPHDNLSAQTRNIQLKKAVEGATFLTFGFTTLRIKYWVPTMDLVKVPSEMLTFNSKDW